MQYIPIKQDNDKFVVPAIKLENSKGVKRIPHPLGRDSITFNTLEEAKKAIELAGFEAMLPNGRVTISQEVSSTNDAYDSKIIDALIKETKDFNPNIVACAINALSEINNANCLDIYLDKLGEDNEKIRQNSIEAIVKFGLKALPNVFNSLKSENWVTRNSAISCLQKLCEIDDVPIEDIINCLLQMLEDNNPVVKCSVIETLGIAYKTYKKQNCIQ